MATKSILKDVRFKDRKLCCGFATALESAKGKRSKAVTLSRTCQTVPKDKVKDFFGEASKPLILLTIGELPIILSSSLVKTPPSKH